TLSATFTPTDTADYTTAQATVSLVVDELPNIASITPETVDEDAEDIFQTDGVNKSGQKNRISQSGKSPNQQGELETRTYKGATYVKGADGQWHLQQK
ncbi:MAG: hypothetical protein ABSG60_16805, partial [Terracidiphilus sp.]